IVFSIMNMCGNIGAAIFPLAVTFVVGTGENANWHNAAWLFIWLFFIDAICWAFLRPQGTLFKENELSEEPAIA
ncbi:MAG: hypothetical protein SGJ20_17550, partial [Planctomycetota bacterium]|nr:hypothetical protein [Planctomycetota bacterium]